MRLRVFLVGILLAAAVVTPTGKASLHAQTPEPTQAQAGAAREVTIRITDGGFDGMPEGYTLNVGEGELVELTFVWDHEFYPAEEHLFVIEGYNVESEEINFYERETTLRFLADKPGSFRLKCDLDCEIHDLLKAGTIEVGRGGAAGAATGALAGAPPTLLAVEAPAAALSGDTVDVRAMVLDEAGAPVSDGVVTLYEVTGFMQAQSQEVAVASARIGADGVAALRYRTPREGNRTLTAYFEGTVDHAPSSSSVELRVAPSTQLYQVAAPVGIPGVNRFLVIALLVGVWGTMFVVALIVVLIARDGARAPEVQDG